jgi:hypothetical protein
MKNNRKNRNLKFIRIKNKLRLGQTSFVYFTKVSNSMELTDGILRLIIEDAKDSLMKACKLYLPECNLMKGDMDDDIIKDLYTIRVSLSLRG